MIKDTPLVEVKHLDLQKLQHTSIANKLSIQVVVEPSSVVVKPLSVLRHTLPLQKLASLITNITAQHFLRF